MADAWDRQDEVKGVTLLVLLAFCDYANDQGYCWPLVASIARRCRLSERSAQRHIDALEEAGLLERHGTADVAEPGKQPTMWRVVMPVAGVTEVAPHGVTEVAPRTIMQVRGGRKKPATPIPDPFIVTPEMKRWAMENGLADLVQKETPRFKEHALANDRRQADWTAAWRQWLLKAQDWQKPGETGRSQEEELSEYVRQFRHGR